jgi:predicted permease
MIPSSAAQPDWASKRSRSRDHLLGSWRDLRQAARSLVMQPAFSIATVITLGLGVGASTAIFSVVYGVLLKPLPFAEPDRLVSLLHHSVVPNFSVMNHGPATYFVATDHQQMLEGVGAWDRKRVSITGRGDPENVEALAVTSTTLGLLRIKPAIGRLFLEADDQPGTPRRLVLTYGYWQRRFGGARDVIGQSLQIDGAPAEIIGVLPSSFRFLRNDPALLFPLQLNRADAFHIEFDFQAFGRLKPGVTLADVERDMGRWLSHLPPVFDRLGLTPYVRPLVAEVIGDVARVLWILLAAVGVVLLIACANVANLFLVRTEKHQQEFAVRAALGASRARIARGVLSESVLLALVGGALGVVLAQGALVLLQRIAPAELPRLADINLNPTVLVFTFVISLVSGFAFGLIAVLRFGAPEFMVLKEGSRAGSSRQRQHTRNAMVVVQVALALMLLIVSGLLVRTFLAMRGVEPGFAQPDNVQTFRVTIPERVIGNPQQFGNAHQQIVQRLSQVPGVVSVGLSSSVTMDGEDNGNPVYVEDAPLRENQLPPLRRYKSVGPGYFETMGNHLVAGRSITWTDIQQRRLVVVISEALAREYWREPASAVGKRIRGVSDYPWSEVVGVVGNERDDGLSRPPTSILYWPLLSATYEVRTIAYAVRSKRAGTASFIREIEQAVWSMNPNLPLMAIQTLSEIQARSMAQTSFPMVMLAIAASVALLLGVVGIYGVITYIAKQRTREIGIRIALGAQIHHVRTMFLRHGLLLIAAGSALGIGAAMIFTRALSALSVIRRSAR